MEPAISIERPIYDTKALKDSFGKERTGPEPTVKSRLVKQWKRFSMKEQLMTWFPISSWLLNYNVKEKLLGDIVAGITIGVVNIPQGMAFAALTLLPPVFGLYVAFFPVIFYVLMGSCHHQSWGGFGVTAIMSGDAVSRILDSQSQSSDTSCETAVEPSLSTVETLLPTFSESMTTQGLDPNTENLDTIIDVAITITLLVGVMQCVMGLLRLGFVSVYLSKSFIQALTTGAACHVVTSQVPRALGITVERFSGPFSIVWSWVEIFKNVPNINWATLIVSLVSLGMLIGMSYINDKYKDKLPVPIPMDMIVVIVITVLSFAININEKFDVAIVDNIPLGFPTPRLPSPSLMSSLLVDSFAIALVTYAVDISLGKIIANKYNYKIDDNQEMLASGVSNFLSSPFLCYVSGPSLARIWIVERAGGRTQLASAVNCVLVLFIMLFLGQLLEPLPLAVLAILLIFSLKGMIWQFRFLPSVYKQSKWDFAVWVFTVTTVIFLGVALGLFASLGFSIVAVAVRLQLPSFREEGMIEGSEIFMNKKKFVVKDNPNYTIFTMENSLCFLNVVSFRRKLMAVSKVESIQVNSKDSEHPHEEELTLMSPEPPPTDATSNADGGDADPDQKDENKNDIVEVEKGDGAVKTEAGEIELKAKEDGGSKHVIIINCSGFNFVDLDGCRMIASIIKDCEDKGVRVVLASCSGHVQSTLMQSGLFDEMEDVFYPTTLDAYISTQGEDSHL